MRTELLRSFALGVMIVAWTTDVHATPITWTLSGVTFGDGGTATGSFVFDADTGDYSDISITTTAGGAAAGAVYAAAMSFASEESVAVIPATLPDLTGSSILFLALDTALTNSGGTILIVPLPSREGICSDIACTVAVAPLSRGVTSGFVTGVPEPTTALLVAGGLAGLGVARRRRSLR